VEPAHGKGITPSVVPRGRNNVYGEDYYVVDDSYGKFYEEDI